jgi:hypothetical protein
MTGIISIPLEVLRFVRKCLVSRKRHPKRFNGGFAEEYDALELFLKEDSYWSWRNFLSASNREDWSQLRRTLMLWTLNSCESIRYFNDSIFRNYLAARMDDPPQQLHCRNNYYKYNLRPLHWFETEFKMNLSIKEVLSAGQIGSLNLSHPVDLVELPSMDSLHSLRIADCGYLQTLGNYKKLKFLELISCHSLSSVGNVDSLSTLHIDDYSNPALFPLEQLTEFCFKGGSDGPPLDYLPRLKNLRTFGLFLAYFSVSDWGGGYGRGYPLPRLDMPHLKSLHLASFSSIDLSGLDDLETLEIERVTCDGWTGMYEEKELESNFLQLKSLMAKDQFVLRSEIERFPKLKSLCCFHSLDGKDKTINFLEMEVYPDPCDYQSSEVSSYEVPGRVKSLSLWGKVVELVGIEEDRSFQKILIQEFRGINLTVLQRVEMVILNDCGSVTDISPLRRYLVLRGSYSINNFSCLGEAQHYLEIGFSHTLTDSDVSCFGNIRCLTLDNCKRITKLNNLTNNRIIRIIASEHITEMCFKGLNYQQIKLQYCGKLKKLMISGKVYSLIMMEKNVRKLEEFSGFNNCTNKRFL